MNVVELMNSSIARFLVVGLALGVGGCINNPNPGPFVEVLHLNYLQRAQVRSEMKRYTDLPPASYTVVKDLDATSCQSYLESPKATDEDAIDQLLFKASSLGANGLSNVSCGSRHWVDVFKNCWSSVKCRGTAIKVSP